MSTTPTTPTEKASNKNIWKKSISKVEEQEWQLQLQKILFKAHIAKVINENNNKISGETLLSLLELSDEFHNAESKLSKDKVMLEMFRALFYLLSLPAGATDEILYYIFEQIIHNKEKEEQQQKEKLAINSS